MPAEMIVALVFWISIMAGMLWLTFRPVTDEEVAREAREATEGVPLVL